MHTKDTLAQALTEAGLHEMAAKAAAGWYHDFMSPLDVPATQLDDDLVAAMTAGNAAARQVRDRHHNGEFDASVEESDEWATSAEGQETLRRLLR